MKQKTKLKFREQYENTTFIVSEELGESMKKPMFPEKIARAKEILSKLDPEQFKAVTGRDLHKK